jgi:ubiquinone/menaquinone biosynthesis C-methylase UbiE
MSNMLPVSRSKREAQRYYDLLSKIYDWMAASERSLIEKGVTILAPVQGEAILEIGCGTGTGLTAISRGMNNKGILIGLDLAYNMLIEAKQKESYAQPNVILLQGDATNLPLNNNELDAVYCAFTLELFSQAEMLAVLGEIHRVLSTTGRLVVVALSRSPRNLAVRMYEFGHRLFPVALDCRPIPLIEIIQNAGWTIEQTEKFMNWGLPVEIVLAR